MPHRLKPGLHTNPHYAEMGLLLNHAIRYTLHQHTPHPHSPCPCDSPKDRLKPLMATPNTGTANSKTEAAAPNNGAAETPAPTDFIRDIVAENLKAGRYSKIRSEERRVGKECRSR